MVTERLTGGRGESSAFYLFLQICRFRMQRCIETRLFVRFFDLDRRNPVDDPEHAVGESECPDGRKESCNELFEEERAIAGKESVGSGGWVECERCECAQKYDSEKSSDAVDTPDVECVIEGKLILERDGKITDHPRNDPDDDRSCGRNVSGSRRDGCQTSHGPCEEPEKLRFLGDQPVDRHPGDSRKRCGDVFVQECAGGDGVDADLASRVEPVPAEPEETRPEGDKRNAVRPATLDPSLPH